MCCGEEHPLAVCFIFHQQNLLVQPQVDIWMLISRKMLTAGVEAHVCTGLAARFDHCGGCY